MNNQEQLLYITNLRVKEMGTPNIRGVTAYWKNNTACLSFYFDGEPTENDIENASDICGNVIASFSEGLLEEHYIRYDYPRKLPEKFLAYRRNIMPS